MDCEFLILIEKSLMKKEYFVVKNVIKIPFFLLIKLNIAFKNKCSINFRENVNHINSAILKITISAVKICVNVWIKSSDHFYQFRIEIKQFISIYFLGNDPENLSGRQGCKERGHKRSPTGTLTLNRDKVTCRHENRKKEVRRESEKPVFDLIMTCEVHTPPYIATQTQRTRMLWHRVRCLATFILWKEMIKLSLPSLKRLFLYVYIWMGKFNNVKSQKKFQKFKWIIRFRLLG